MIRLTIEVDTPLLIGDESVRAIAEAVNRAAWEAARQEVGRGNGTIRVTHNAAPSIFALESSL